MATKEDIKVIVAKMGAAFPNWQVTAFTLQVYFEDLKDLDGEQLRLAADMCRTENGRKFAPSTGELRGAVSRMTQMSSNAPDSYQAWREVCRAITDYGYTGTPEFSHPLVTEAVKRMGWRNLCMSEDQVSDRARFVACYEQLQERAETETMLLPEVRGYIEVHGGKMLEAPASQMARLTDKLKVN
jgi:hypothetical protein